MSAQTEIELLREEEKRIQFDRFDYDVAYRIGNTLRKEALQKNVAVTIDIRAFDQILYHVAMPGTSPDNDQWVERKSAVVMRFHGSSFRIGRQLASSNQTIDEKYFVDPRAFSAHGGSFPIRLRGGENDDDGGVIGAVTVSGLPQAEDHALVVSVLERFIDPSRNDSALQ